MTEPTWYVLYDGESDVNQRGIYKLWDSFGEELRECYALSVIGKLWSIQ